MATLKGQNFRILTYNSTTSKWSVIGMATSCTVTLGTTTDEASTKDDLGLSSKPEVTAKNWQVQVESLNVSDVGAMLTAIKALTKFKLLWDEVDTDDNQTPEGHDVSRQGDAYLSDATFTFDDRANSTKSLQFTGASELSAAPTTPALAAVTAGSYTKGQYVRLFLGSDNTTTPAKVIAAAKSLAFHVSMTLEDSTTKDTTGDWTVQEPTALSYDITSSALVRSGETITSSVAAQAVADIQSIYESSDPVKWQIANVSSTNNRTKGSVIASGSAIISQLTLNAANRQNATYDTTLTGWGAYTVGA